MKDERLAEFDRLAVLATDSLLAHLTERRGRLIALARERFEQGFTTYPDGPIFEWTEDHLSCERDEETADSIVYEVFRLALRDRANRLVSDAGSFRDLS